MGYSSLLASSVAAWIEPALIAEWIRLMKLYAQRQGRALEAALLAATMD